MKYCRIQLQTPVCVGTSLSEHPFHTRTLLSRAIHVSSIDAGGGIWSSVVPLAFVRWTHLVESRESPAFLGSSELLCSSSRSASFSADSDAPPPSLAMGPDGPGKEAGSEVPALSVGTAVCMIFWRTSRIFNCKHTLVGKISEYRAWKAAVAWATETKTWNVCKDQTEDFLHELGYASFWTGWGRLYRERLKQSNQSIHVKVRKRFLMKSVFMLFFSYLVAYFKAIF